MLMLPNREVWTFNAYEDRVELEESVYLAGSDGPRRAVQIVIYGRARKVPRVHWTFAHIASPVQRAAASAATNPNCRWSRADRHHSLSLSGNGLRARLAIARHD